MTKAFENKVALVTGGGTGIGEATAKHLAEEGAKVIITGRTEASLRASAAQHANIDVIVADVGKVADAARTIEEVKKKYGRLDVLVNNAGVAPVASISDATPDHVAKVFQTNVLGLIELTRTALPLLEKSKGTIVNVASTVGDEPFANMSVYSASKAAVLALTRAWAQELAARGVRVNAVSPGPIETPIFAPDKLGVPASQIEQMGASILALVPIKRFGKPEEVAHVIAFVASSKASFVTGAQYTVGGGIEA
jgi:NAD(P)-dependent dehydrogenase (short-subunit alcohol dehydrogenase family)